MDFADVKTLWRLTKKHPITALVLLFSWSVISIGLEIIRPKVLELFQPASPFANLDGEYTGSILRSGPFIFCVKTYKHDEATNHQLEVTATMSFPQDVYVEYWGHTSGNILNLQYRRVNSAKPDAGTAVFYAPQSKDGTLDGYYRSDGDPKNHQDLHLVEDGKKCNLADRDQGY